MALLQTLIDNFNSGINLTKWTTAANADPTEITFPPGVIKIAHLGTSEYEQYVSAATYDLTGSYAFVEIIDRGDQTIISHEVILGVFKDGSNEVWFSISNGGMSAYKRVGGVQTQVGSTISYNTTAHKYIRIRESGGTIFWDTSPDGITWTNQWSVANPFVITTVNVELQSGCWQNEATGSYAIFDNFNTLSSTFSFTTDGIVKVKSNIFTLTADGVIVVASNSKTKTFTTDGLIHVSGQKLTFFVDGLINDKDLVELLVDNWYTGSIGAKWNNWAGSQASIVNNQLRLTSILAGSYFGVDSAGVAVTTSMNFVESFAQNQLIDAGDQSITSWEVYPIYVTKDDGVFNNQVHWIVAGGVVMARKNIAGVTTAIWSASYNSKIHKFFRIRETGGKVYFDYSIDGITWVTPISITDPFTLTRVRAGIQIGTWEAEPRITHATFDNFNCPILTMGAFDPDHLDVLQPLVDFEYDAGKKVGISMWYQGWDSLDGTHLFQKTWMDNVRKHGATPMITWEARRWWVADVINQTDFKLTNITAGAWDSYITTFAQACADWGFPMLLRPFHEMNGNWYPWDTLVNGNAVGDLVAAWKHVYNIFQAVGATNVKFVWSPNNIDPTLTPYSLLYPGDSYVDYVGVDSYNWGTSQATFGSWTDFYSLFHQSYLEILGLTHKPFIYPEFASTEIGGDKAAWFTQTFNSDIFQQSRAVGFIYFNINKETDWRIESSPTAQAAFNTAMQLPVFSNYPLIDARYDSKTSTIFDDWSSGTIDTTKWSDWSKGRASIVSQALQIHSELAPAYYGVGASANGVVHDFKESQVTCYLVGAGNQGLASFEVYPLYVSLFATSGYQLNWLVSGNQIIAKYTVGGIATVIYTATYDSSRHRFFRIRETAGVCYWDWSIDGITWINVGSVADPFDLTFVDFGSQVGTFAIEAATSTATLDNFNVQQVPGAVGVHGTQYGFFLNGTKLKNPVIFAKDYVYRKTTQLVMSGKTTQDFTGLKQQYTLSFKNLNQSQVNDITAIMDLKTAITFTVNGNDLVNINTVVWPYIGSIVYQTLGSNYLADATINLVEVTTQ